MSNCISSADRQDEDRDLTIRVSNVEVIYDLNKSSFGGVMGTED